MRHEVEITRSVKKEPRQWNRESRGVTPLRLPQQGREWGRTNQFLVLEQKSSLKYFPLPGAPPRGFRHEHFPCLSKTF